MHHWISALQHWPADHWAALAAWITALVAAAASIFAFWQVREARRLREEQAKPYVVAYMTSNEASQHLVDLVVRNFGTTLARDVRMKATPTLQRSSHRTAGGVEEVWIFDCLPMLVPGQEWRTWWDNSPDRSGTSLPTRYEVTIHYKDRRGKEMEPTRAVLDWSAYKGRMWVDTFGMHQAAKALTEIQKTVAKWTEFGGDLGVVVRDGDARDAREKEERQRIVAELTEERATHTAAGAPSGGAGDLQVPERKNSEEQPGDRDADTSESYGQKSEDMEHSGEGHAS